MMTTKGTTLVVIPDFIVKKFGEEAKKKWLEALTPEAKQIFSGIILPSATFDLKSALVEPTLKMCELFYSNDLRGAFELGRFSADFALSGIYKFFVKFGTPAFTIKKAGSILPTYYDPSVMEVGEVGDNNAILRITKFPEMHQVIEKRISGWMERAMELTGGKNIRIVISKSLAGGDPYTEFIITWQ